MPDEKGNAPEQNSGKRYFTIFCDGLAVGCMPDGKKFMKFKMDQGQLLGIEIKDATIEELRRFLPKTMEAQDDK